jgi:hypothetical protein
MRNYFVGAALAAVTCLAASQVVFAPTTAGQKHGDWASIVRVGDIKSARALTSVANGNVLFLDFFEGGGCVVPQVTILVPLKTETDTPWSNAVNGSFRIDQLGPITFDGTSTSSLGDKYILIEVKTVASVGKFLRQLAEGGNVRFQIGDASSTVVEKFSLTGAAPAMRRAMQLCEQF